MFDALPGSVLVVHVLPYPLSTKEVIRDPPSRRHLFFDEKIEVTVVWKISAKQADIETLLRFLELTLSAHATDAAPQGPSSAGAATNHDIFVQTQPAHKSTEILTLDTHVYTLWRITVHLKCPLARRLLRPAIYFTATLTPSTTHKPSVSKELTPFEPLPANILAPLNRTLDFSNAPIYLGEDKLNKLSPPQSSTHGTPIRGATRRAFPALQALGTTIRYVPTSERSLLLLALRLETSQHVAGTFTLKRVDARVPEAQIYSLQAAAAEADQAVREGRVAASSPESHPTLEPLNGISLPLALAAGDVIVWVYGLDAHPSGVLVEMEVSIALETGTKVEIRTEGVHEGFASLVKEGVGLGIVEGRGRDF
ncbi:hypothetical protein K470DRAFT_293291 [Piedraia hortae CBS 480.64]|uniref:Uncharacterized protein n=1 Tax=Piedraia hortae CBS 480.64 TaxID=1314780 RepID=A0A6A7C6Q6_9PEZI|nr:hypothetical protein K470DRAFT_293291 [Piedraia hortae CBS 480.64]